MIVNKHGWDYSGLNIVEFCPICKADLEILENGKIKCINPGCSQKVSHLIANFFEVLDIKGAGPSFYNKASLECNSLFTFLTQVTYEENSKRWAGGINGVKICKAVYKARQKPTTLSKFLALFDLEGFGEKKLNLLKPTKFYRQFDEITEDNLFKYSCQMEIFFPEIVEGMENEQKELLYKELSKKIKDIVLCKNLFNIIKEQKPSSEIIEGKLTGKSFCFTGAMAFSRKELEQKVIDNGGEISSVKKGLTYLVQADPNSTSSKSVKAKSLGIEIISLETFLSIIEEC